MQPPATSARTAGQHVGGIRVNDNIDAWGAEYGNDYTWNITSIVYNGGAFDQVGIPSAALRGGDWMYGSRGGVFALYLSTGPSSQTTSVGFRCVVSR